MKASNKILALTATLTALATGAFANTVTLNPGTLAESPDYRGGEFTAYSATLSNSSYAPSAKGLPAGSFETFCLAYDQEFSYNETLGYTLTNQTADPGAIQALTVGTAYLYSQFATGAIRFTDGADMTNFQLALWWLQQSPGTPAGILTYNSSNTYEQMVYTMFGDGTSAGKDHAAAGANNYGVSIILTTHSNGTYAQPQLYYSVPDQGTTVALLGLALLGLVGFRRRFAK